MNADPTYKEQICRAIGWDADQYRLHQFETGMSYLEHYLKGDHQGVQMLSRTKTFWVWWCRQWERRNRILLHKLNKKHRFATTPKADFKKLYEQVHHHECLSVYPGRVVMEKSYAEMMGQLIDEEHSKTTHNGTNHT